MTVHILVATGAFLASVFGQVAYARAKPATSLLHSLAVGFVIGLCLCAVANAYLTDSSISFFASDSLLFTSAYYCYFHLVNIGEASVRIRILREIADSAEGVTIAQIVDTYGAKTILRIRLQRLLHAGEITQHGERYYLGTRRLIRVAHFFRLLKRIVYGQPAAPTFQRI